MPAWAPLVSAATNVADRARPEDGRPVRPVRPLRALAQPWRSGPGSGWSDAPPAAERPQPLPRCRSHGNAGPGRSLRGADLAGAPIPEWMWIASALSPFLATYGSLAPFCRA